MMGALGLIIRHTYVAAASRLRSLDSSLRRYQRLVIVSVSGGLPTQFECFKSCHGFTWRLQRVDSLPVSGEELHFFYDTYSNHCMAFDYHT
jgi:hypothetical protein